MPFPKSVKPGVVTGQALMDLLAYAKETGFGACRVVFGVWLGLCGCRGGGLSAPLSKEYVCVFLAALPAVNCVSSSSVNAILEAAREVNSPVMLQVSNGGGAFYGGKGLSNAEQAGAVAGRPQMSIEKEGPGGRERGEQNEKDGSDLSANTVCVCV